MSDQQPPFQDDPSPDYASTPPPPPPPPPGYAPPPPQPPGYAAPPGEQPLSQSDERLWAMLAHLSEIVLAIIAPLLIMVLLGKRSAFVEDQAKEALNFHITLLIASAISWVLIFVFIGIFTLIAVIIYGFVFAIIAAIKSYNGELYRYPLTFRFVK